jgi:NAD(P)-dependent dehydrogenase (short-subunit alcohol dehydrogenase family)
MLAEGFVENGARVVIIGRRAEVLDQAVREMNEEYASVAGGSVYAWVTSSYMHKTRGAGSLISVCKGTLRRKTG